MLSGGWEVSHGYPVINDAFCYDHGHLDPLVFFVGENIKLIDAGRGLCPESGIEYQTGQSSGDHLFGRIDGYCYGLLRSDHLLGLAVPHLCRAVFQTSDHRLLMPACLVMGASLALACNLIARMPGFEGALPVNSVTALIGAPVVASVLFRKRKNELNE